MAACKSFQTQLASVLDLLTKSAVAQICKLVEQECSHLRREITRVAQENEALTERIRCLESELADTRRVRTGARRRRADASRSVAVQTGETNRGPEPDGLNHPPSINGIFGKEWCINLWKDGEPRGECVSDDEIHYTIMDECAKDQIALLSIKEEDPEEEICSSISNAKWAMIKERGGFTDGNGRHPTERQPAAEEDLAHLISLDSSEELEPQPEPPCATDDPQTAFISLQEYEEEGEKELIAFEGLPGNQAVFVAATGVTNSESSQANTQKRKLGRRKKLHCKICGKRFSRQNCFTLHLKSHKGVRPHKSKECKGALPPEALRQKHKHVRRGKMKYCCEQCGRGCTSLANLRVHSFVHTGEKPHRCSVCGKGFTQKGNLKAHQRIHTGEKPFSCSTCGKSFTQKVNLRHHALIHRKELGEEKPRSNGNPVS
ncbi:zinc finger protein 771 isoform X2 [Denticeps clupeoides]|uniref:C2H2-type domain-containing protein n=1 Tax=Denticeps clupeoides TaxID=299321 RepID=A0AAY4DI98_9TELE|nr:zinc finger protein 771-like isoform X2 [Denticeps clupeoides]